MKMQKYKCNKHKHVYVGSNKDSIINITHKLIYNNEYYKYHTWEILKFYKDRCIVRMINNISLETVNCISHYINNYFNKDSQVK